MLAAAAVMDLQFAHTSKLLLQPYQRSRDNVCHRSGSHEPVSQKVLLTFVHVQPLKNILGKDTRGSSVVTETRLCS